MEICYGFDVFGSYQFLNNSHINGASGASKSFLYFFFSFCLLQLRDFFISNFVLFTLFPCEILDSV